MKIHQIIGPPGTGKTTTIGEILKAKEDVLGVVALSFTRAAKWALLRKGGGRRLDKEQIRTIHSMAFRSLGLTTNNILLDGQIAAFFRSQGLNYRIEGHGDAIEGAPGNKAEAVIGRAIHTSTRHSGATRWECVERAILEDYDPSGGLYIQPKALLTLARKYWEHQRTIERWSFDGVLLRCLEEGGLDVQGTDLILDEAQDLTPIMQDLLVPRFPLFQNVYVVGDDDQAIFSYAGADPEFLLLIAGEHTRTLATTYRLPAKIHAMAAAYIGQNKVRLEKKFSPDDAQGPREGVVKITRGLQEAIAKAERPGYLKEGERPSTMILSRTRRGARAICDALAGMGMRHRQLGADPVKASQTVERCCNVLWAARHGTAITPDEWSSAIYHLRPEIMEGLPPKAEIKNMLYTTSTPEEMRSSPAAAELWERLSHTDYRAFRCSEKLRPWWPLWRGRDKYPEPEITVGTIHQAKGLEADHVILDCNLSARVKAQLTTEAERRVWYVAITRARHQLTLSGLGHKELIRLANLAR